MEKTLTARFTDQLLLLSIVLGLERRQLISRSGINQPFGFAALAAAASINAGPLRVAFDSLKAFGWLSQASDDEYFFKGQASAIDSVAPQLGELFALLAPGRAPGAEDLPHLWRWLELSALDWNLHCPVFIRGLDELLSLVLLRRLQLDGALDTGTGQVDIRRLDHARIDPERARQLGDFLRRQRWVRREERQLQLNPERGALIRERLSEPFLAYYASLPVILDDLLFGTGPQWAGALQWLKGAGEQLAWPGDRSSLQQLLGKVFDAQPWSTQPDWIVEFGNPPDASQEELWHWVGQHTARGQALDSRPLRRLKLDGLLSGDPARLRQQLRDAGVGAGERVLWLGIGQQSRQAPLAARRSLGQRLAQRYYLGSDGLAVEDGSVLDSLRGSFQALAALIGDQPVVLSEYHGCPQEAQVDRFACYYPVAAVDYLMALAGAGLFADPGMLHKLPRDGMDCEASSGCYQARDYCVRQASLDDLPALLALEWACWPEGGRVDESILRRRLGQNPCGQLALEFKGEVVGVIYSQRITQVEGLFGVNFATVDQLFNGNGSTVQIQSLNILPEHQYSGYGDQLLEFMLQYCTLLNGVDTVVGVTRCKDYPKYRHMPQADYLHCRDERGVLLDPVLRFHELHGARIEQLVAGYRPADADNRGYGVLVRYDLACRQRQEVQRAPAALELPAIAIDDAVRQGINRCLGQALDSRLSPRHSLMELGLDSADLLALSEQLVLTLGVALESTFFFRYNSFEKIVAALQERLGGPLPPASAMQPSPAHADSAPLKQPSSRSATDADDFAVIGISGCFPGGELEAFWAALRSGVSQIREVPAGRAMVGPPAGYIDEIECFDPGFFGLSPAEARLMDPQQRLLLQHAWWALDDAAMTAAQFARRPTGVFIAAAPSEYREIVEIPRDSPFLLTSSSPCMYANRISYFLDLRGPSEYCNSACSSALVALHRAMQAIRAGECRQALVGAVNLLLSADETASYRQMGFLSEQAQARSFQAGADGYVRAEGVAVLLLKPLAEAVRDGDRIHLKIKGSGVGHGGRGAALTAPDHDGMQAAMVAAYRSAGVAPDSVSYLEAHGVGSAIGDAIEIAAIQAARKQLSAAHGAEVAWNISSLKPLIGHCELASGMAALFKVIDAIRQRQLPGIAGYVQPSPQVAQHLQQLCLSPQSRPWPALKDCNGLALPRRASINSYGFGGVNAHLVVEEYQAPQCARPGDSGPQLLLLSARDADRLKEQAARLSRFISQHPDLCLADVAYTLQAGRTAMACRWACVADSLASLQQQLGQLARERPDASVMLDEQALLIDPRQGEMAEDVARALQGGDLPALAGYWRQGVALDWRQLPRAAEARRIALPGYAFARERHWLAPRRVEAARRLDADQAPPANSLRSILGELLGCAPQALLGCESRSLASLGLSSLGAVGLKARLEQQLHLSVSLAQLSPYLSLGDVERGLATLQGQGADQAVPVLLVAPDAWREPFALNDIQQSFWSGRTLLAAAQRVGCHIYLEFDWPDLDIYRLNQAWNRLLARHDVLRIRLRDDGRQQVGEPTPYRFKIRDLRRAEPAERERSLSVLRGSMSHKVYLAGQAAFFEISVSLLDPQYSRVHLSIDELLVDATSVELLLQQWLMVYREPAAELPDQGLSFRDYQLSLDAFRSSPRYQRDLQYWVDKLAQAPAGLCLPKALRPAGRERRRLTSTLEQGRWRRLKEQGDALQVSGTALLLTLFGLVLRPANADKAFSLICTLYGRSPVHPAVDRLIGPLISTQCFAFDCAPDETLAELAQRVQRQLLEDLNHSSASAVSALREIRRRGDPSLAAGSGEVVFTSMLNNPAIEAAQSFGDARHYCVTQTPQINLDHQLRECGGALSFSWDVAIDCYPDGMIDQLFCAYCQLLVMLADADGWALKAAGLVERPPLAEQSLAVADPGHSAPFKLAPGATPTMPFALTDQQQAYAFSRTLRKGQGSSHLYLAVAMERLDIPRLEQAWQQLVAHHPMLRARVLPNGTQQIMAAAPWVPLQADGQNLDGVQIAEQMLGRVTALGEWPYVELRVSTLDERRSLVHLVVDLLLVDLPSRDLLIHQLLAIYHGRPPAPLSINFADYRAALGQYNRSPAAQSATRYWQEKFRMLPQGPQVDLDRDADGDYREYEYCLDCWPALRERLEQAGLSADALLIAVYAWSLARHGTKQAFTLVAPGWKRLAVHPDIELLVGDFTTLSWVDFDDQPMTLLERALRCERIFSMDQLHGTVSGLQALRKVATDKQRPRKLDFSVVFTRLNPQGPLDLPEGVTLIKSSSRTHGVALDNLSIEQQDGLLIHWDLAPGGLAPARVEGMFADYCCLLEMLAADEQAWGLREDSLESGLLRG